MIYTSTTQSTEEAMELFYRYRKSLIIKGRIKARIRCIDKGSCHSRHIYHEMKDEVEGYCELKGYDVSWFWLGAIFRRSEFEWTGEWHDVAPNEPTNVHGGHLIRVWRLKYDA